VIPELGQVACLLALAVALVQGTLPIAGAARGHRQWMALARPAAQTQCLLVIFAFGALAYSFAHNDFSVLYVAQNSNSALPLHWLRTSTSAMRAISPSHFRSAISHLSAVSLS